MTITSNLNPKMVPIGYLKVKDCFRFFDEYFIVTDRDCRNIATNITPVVNLITGHERVFASLTMVIPINISAHAQAVS